MENEGLNIQNNGLPGNSGNFTAEKPRIPIREGVFAWCAFALAFVFTHFCVKYAGGVWGGIFWAAVGIFIAVYAVLNDFEFTRPHIVMLGAAELFCLTPLFSANRFVCFLAAVYSFALYFYLMIAVTGTEAFGRHFVLDFFRSILIRPFESFLRQPVCAFSVFKGKKRTKNILYALSGLALSIPLTIVVVLLLASSDEAFGKVIKGVLEWLPEFSFNLIWELMFAVPIAMYLFGAMFSMRNPAPVNREGAPDYRFLPSVIAYFTVSPICVFYLIYVIVQVASIADTFGKNISYADFARQGFFELCVIALINLGVIAVMQTFCKRDENDVKPIVLRVYSVMISALTLLIIATALIKMFMYIGQYGMTMLRVYTSWFMILLGAVFIPIIVLQIRDFSVWKVIFAVFTVMFAMLCFGNFEGNIAAYNIAAYQSGAIEKLDVGEFKELGIAAVSPAYKLYSECDDERLAGDLEWFIEHERADDENIPRFAFFSVPRAMAWSAYREFEIEAENSFRVTVDMNCGGIYSVRTEYLLSGKLVGAQEYATLDGGTFSKGEKLVFEFGQRDLENLDNLSEEKFGAFFRVVNDVGGYEICPNIPTNWANSSESCDGTQYSLSEGFFEDGSASEPVWEWDAELGGKYEFVLRENKDGGYYLYPVH